MGFMNTSVLLSDLALDLKRVAIGYYRGSDKMAERFSQEALMRKKEIEKLEIKPYLQELLRDTEKVLHEKNFKEIAEDALMYSTLFQNAALKT